VNPSFGIKVAHETLRRQLRVIFDAWGMPPEQSEPTVAVMAETDLRGIDSHGIVMIDNYNALRRAG
jgi:LDH2 family malate/lactate/ureidoglycolate dehydrogenase